MADHSPSNAELAIAEPHRDVPAAARRHDFIEGEFREVPAQPLRHYLRVLQKHAWLAAGCFVASLAVAVVITVLTPRAYTATTRIQVARSSPIKLQLKDNVLDLEESDRILNGGSSFLATQVQALKSRDVAERAVRAYRLAENPAFAEPPQGGTALAAVVMPLPSFLQPRGLTEAAVTDAPVEPAEGPVDPILLDRYMSYLTVEDMRGTDLIDIRFTAPNPALAALLAAAHVQAYLGTIKASQVATDSTAMEFLGQQLAEARTRVERTEAALADFAAAHPDVAVNQEDELIGKQIGELSALLSVAEGKRAEAQSRYEFLDSAKRKPLQHVLNESEAIGKLRLALLDIQAQHAALKQRLGPNHSQMRELKRQETEARQQLDGEVRQEIAAARARFNEAKLHEQQLRTRLTEREKKATKLRALGGEYEMLKAERESARGLHESLLKQKTDTAVHSELAASNIRVIERPEVPRIATKPRVPLNLLFGALAGVVLAVGAAFFRESLDSSVKSSEEAEGLLQLPTLAIIPNFALPRPVGARLLDTLRQGDGVAGIFATLRRGDAVRTNGDVALGGARRDLVVVQEPSSPVAETFRMLRTALLFSSPGAPPQVILITSAAAGEGKTVTAVNLASTLADAGRHVLLIDVDLRHPGCHELLGSRLSPGLSSYLAGAVDLDRTVREVASPHIAFLSAGPPPPNPAELIGSDRMREALALLRKHFDFVILDSPPVLPVTDAVLLARLADAVVLVMNGKKSPREFVRRARDQLVQVGGNVIGVVVNNAGPDWGSAYLYDYDRYRRAPTAAAEAPVA